MASKKKGIRFVTKSITPKMATNMLKKNKVNRRLRQGLVLRYALDMAEGNWTLTHQPICIGRRSALIDGQHRLEAVVLADVTVKMVVAYSDTLTKPLEAKIDCGGTRSLADRTGLRRKCLTVARFLTRTRGSRFIVSEQEILDTYDLILPAYASLMDACAVSRRIFSTAAVKAAAVTLLIQHPNHAEFIKTCYASVNLEDPSLSNPFVWSFWRQAHLGEKWRGERLAEAAYVAFDPMRKDDSQIHNMRGDAPKRLKVAVMSVLGYIPSPLELENGKE